MEIPTTAVGLAGVALTGLAAAVKALWSDLRSRETRCEERCERRCQEFREREAQLTADLKAERIDHLKTLRISDALAQKLERVRGSNSSPPPSC